MKKVLKDIKLIKKLLETTSVEFTVNGLTGWGKKEDGTYADVLRKFHTNCKDGQTGSIYDEYMSGMNVNKFGPTCVTLYTFDMLNNRTTSKIRYEDVEIIKDLTLPIFSEEQIEAAFKK